jgi:hypothetical protein
MVVVMAGSRQEVWWRWALCKAIEQNADIISFFAGQRGRAFLSQKPVPGLQRVLRRKFSRNIAVE